VIVGLGEGVFVEVDVGVCVSVGVEVNVGVIDGVAETLIDFVTVKVGVFPVSFTR